MEKYIITISFQNGKNKAGLIQSLKDGLYAIQKTYPNYKRSIANNHGVTCYMQPLEKLPGDMLAIIENDSWFQLATTTNF